jgi:hypothetical protein
MIRQRSGTETPDVSSEGEQSPELFAKVIVEFVLRPHSHEV